MCTKLIYVQTDLLVLYYYLINSIIFCVNDIMTAYTLAFFLLFYQTDFKLPVLRKSLTKISLLSLDMYLCCYLFDAMVYPYFMEHYFVNQSQFGIYFFVIVPILFISSFLLAWVKEGTFCLVKRLI